MSDNQIWERIKGEIIPSENLGIWPLGGGSAAIRTGNITGFIDPFFSNWSNEEWIRRFPPLVDPRKIHDCDFILITHEHEDHFDPVSISQLLENNKPKILAPPSVIQRLDDEPRRDIIEKHLEIVHPGDNRDIEHCRIRMIETKDPLSESALGFLVKAGRATACFLGDSLYDPDMLSAISTDNNIQAFFIALGDNPPGEKYYFSIDELRRAAEAVAPSLLVPIHWDLWTKTYINPLDYDLDKYENIRIIKPGQLLKI